MCVCIYIYIYTNWCVSSCFPPPVLDLQAPDGGRGQFTLQITGVLGASGEDPEICYERLVAAAAPGSALQLWRRGDGMGMEWRWNGSELVTKTYGWVFENTFHHHL